MNQAPAHNPNQEYDAIEDAPEVFCEDLQKKLPEPDCRKVGNVYYSKTFLDSIAASCQEMLETAEFLNNHIDKFFRDGSSDFKKIEFYIGNIAFENACLRDLFAKIDISPKEKKK